MARIAAVSTFCNKKEVSDFFQELNSKYTSSTDEREVVTQINIQILKLTEGSSEK